MIDTDLSVPHAARLVRRIQGLDAPIVQVWGWPGTGRSAVLEALLQAEPERAVGLSLADLLGPTGGTPAGSLGGGMDERMVGARWLVASTVPADHLGDLARRLRPGQRLVFSATRRLSELAGLPSAVISPQELLLEPREVSELWHLLAGSPPDRATALALHTATDGWYEPLRLALEATGGTGIAGATEETLLEMPQIRSFLRYEVLDALTPEEQELLLDDPPPPAEWLTGGGRPGWRRLIAVHGLWVDSPQAERPPRLLAAFLERQRRRRPPAARPAAVGVEQRPRPVSRQEPPPTFALGLLGEWFARQRDAATGVERDLGWRLRRSFQVLAFLASSPDLQAGREELIEAIWPREGERTIDRNFHPTLSHLRRSLEGEGRGQVPPPLLFRGGVYRLNPEINWEIDLVSFQRLVEEGRRLTEREALEPAAEAWTKAWRLYRGPFLQGFYDAWVSARRESAQQVYLELLRGLGDLHLRLDRATDALDAYRSVLLEDPLQERVHLAVMRLYAAQGRRDLVRRQYDRLCGMLVEELGVEPLPETTQEYHRLMS